MYGDIKAAGGVAWERLVQRGKAGSESHRVGAKSFGSAPSRRRQRTLDDRSLVSPNQKRSRDNVSDEVNALVCCVPGSAGLFYFERLPSSVKA